MMNKTLADSFFNVIEMAPRDPILGINEAYNADKNPNKVNLGVGVYYDDNGKVPVLECVHKAEEIITEENAPHTYQPIDGSSAYNLAVQSLVFGKDSKVVKENRVATVQSLGGTGALKIGADFLKRFLPTAKVWISNPSWENHRALFEAAGFEVNAYPYYDPKTRGVDFDAMMSALNALPEKAVVLLHACCHNPTGADLSDEQWAQVISIIIKRGLIPFLDMAYQGFSEGIEKDGVAVRKFAEAGGPLFVSNSFSKSFSLYGERVGALSVLGASQDDIARTISQLKRVIRTNYSNPPIHGAKVITKVLTDEKLCALWEKELGEMRHRIHIMRRDLVEKLEKRIPNTDFHFITKQHGMFSYSGLTKEQVERLRDNFSIYVVNSGRICVAALNSHNIDTVADAIAKVW